MSRREFSAKTKLAAWERCGGKCEGADCGVKLTPGRFHYDHEIPDAMGGEPTLENCTVLCLPCHALKTTKADVPAIAKSVRIRKRAAGIKKPRTIRQWRRFNGDPVNAPRER